MTVAVEAVLFAPKVIARQTDRYGLWFVVESPREMNRDAPEINGMTVILAWEGEAALYRVKATHRRLPAIPIQPGEQIALLVEPVE